MREIISPLSGFRSPFGPNLGSSDPLPVLSLNLLSGVIDSRVTFSRTTHATMFDATGKLTFAPNNLLLNTATLSTQSVTLAAGNYLLSFTGTGSVAITGAGSGTLNGTGVSNRVTLAFAATAGSATLTVTGSVTAARLSRVTYETSFRSVDDLETTGSAYYGPRFDYDPATLAARGLLIEESRTNKLTNSQTAGGTNWSLGTGITATQNAASSPDGTTTGASLLEVADFNGRQVSTPAFTFATGLETLSMYPKANGRDWFNLQMVDSVGTSRRAWFNLATAALGTVQTNLTATLTAIRNNWYRCTTTVSAPGYGGTRLGSAVVRSDGDVDATGVLGDITKGMFLWGAQVEVGAFATSYIPTLAAAVTRAADIATMTSTNFSSWYSATEGTILAEFASPASGVRTIFAIDDNTANESLIIYTSGTDLKFKVVDGGATQCDITIGTIAANTVYKVAVRYKANDFAGVMTGGSVQTDVTGTLPTVDRARIGSSQAGEYLCGPVSRVDFYATALNNSALAAMVA